MSGKESKRSPYCMRERNKKTHSVKKSKLESEKQANTSYQNQLEVCSFVEKCLRIAEKKKTKETKKRNSKINMRISHSGMYKL